MKLVVTDGTKLSGIFGNPTKVEICGSAKEIEILLDFCFRKMEEEDREEESEKKGGKEPIAITNFENAYKDLRAQYHDHHISDRYRTPKHIFADALADGTITTGTYHDAEEHFINLGTWNS